MPGPRAPTIRPSLKTTARSYSFKILIPLMISTMAMTTNVAKGPKPNMAPPLSACQLAPRHSTHSKTHSFDTNYFHLLTDLDLPVRFSVPVLSMNKHLARRVEFAPNLANFTNHALHP